MKTFPTGGTATAPKAAMSFLPMATTNGSKPNAGERLFPDRTTIQPDGFGRRVPENSSTDRTWEPPWSRSWRQTRSQSRQWGRRPLTDLPWVTFPVKRGPFNLVSQVQYRGDEER